MNNKKAYALVELLVVVGILGVVVGGISASNSLLVRSSRNVESESYFAAVSDSMKLILAHKQSCTNIFVGKDLSTINQVPLSMTIPLDGFITVVSPAVGPSPSPLSPISVGKSENGFTFTQAQIFEKDPNKREVCNGKATYATTLTLSGDKRAFAGQKTLTDSFLVYLVTDANHIVTECSMGSTDCTSAPIVAPPSNPIPTCRVSLNTTNVRLGQGVNLTATWNEAGLPLNDASDLRVVEVISQGKLVGDPDVVQAVNVPVTLPSGTVTVNPPVGVFGKYRSKYRVRITGSSGSSDCVTPDIDVCPLPDPVYDNYRHEGPNPELYCVTCDHWFTTAPVGSPFIAATPPPIVQYVADTNLGYPGLIPIYDWYSPLKEDHWDAPLNSPPPGGQGYGAPTGPKYYGFANATDAPNLVGIYQWVRLSPQPLLGLVFDTQQDSWLSSAGGPGTAQTQLDFLAAIRYVNKGLRYFVCSP